MVLLLFCYYSIVRVLLPISTMNSFFKQLKTGIFRTKLLDGCIFSFQGAVFITECSKSNFIFLCPVTLADGQMLATSHTSGRRHYIISQLCKKSRCYLYAGRQMGVPRYISQISSRINYALYRLRFKARCISTTLQIQLVNEFIMPHFENVCLVFIDLTRN